MGKPGKVIITFNPPNPKERMLWPVNPATKIIKSKKIKSRKRLNQEVNVMLREEELEKESE